MSAGEQPENEVQKGPEEDTAPRPVGQLPDDGHEPPLFLRDGNEGRMGNAQDEKDGVGE